MIPPDASLYIYEVRGDPGRDLPPPPSSFIGLWNEETCVYLFFTQPEDDYVRDRVCREDLRLLSRNTMKYGDWQTGLPGAGITAGGVRFVPTGSGIEVPGSVVVDPSVVFGDGTHPTTLACLAAMKLIVDEYEISSLLDLGTGSGILALAAARLGIERVVAVDRNRLAVDTARRNVKDNGLADVIGVEDGEARIFLDKPFDIVAANLPFQVLREISGIRSANLHTFWIVSGIYPEQGALLRELFCELGYETFHEASDPPWETFALIKSPSVS